VEDFAQVIDQHQELVFRTLARLTGRAEDLEDLAQEVFLRLFRGLAHFEGRAKLTTFLYRIILNVVKDEWAREQQERRLVSLDDEDAGWADRLPHPALDPGESFERNELQAAVEACLHELDMRSRAVLVLYYQEQRSYEEISTILELPVGTVKTHLHRARQRLKQGVEQRISPCRMNV
jgi:RNA polymerase sigma-70 factor (ECF subfamily)